MTGRVRARAGGRASWPPQAGAWWRRGPSRCSFSTLGQRARADTQDRDERGRCEGDGNARRLTAAVMYGGRGEHGGREAGDCRRWRPGRRAECLRRRQMRPPGHWRWFTSRYPRVPSQGRRAVIGTGGPAGLAGQKYGAKPLVREVRPVMARPIRRNANASSSRAHASGPRSAAFRPVPDVDPGPWRVSAFYCCRDRGILAAGTRGLGACGVSPACARCPASPPPVPARGPGPGPDRADRTRGCRRLSRPWICTPGSPSLRASGTSAAKRPTSRRPRADPGGRDGPRPQAALPPESGTALFRSDRHSPRAFRGPRRFSGSPSPDGLAGGHSACPCSC